jgi:hypothetical protein
MKTQMALTGHYSVGKHVSPATNDRQRQVSYLALCQYKSAFVQPSEEPDLNDNRSARQLDQKRF